VHAPETDDDMLRLVGSCANETAEAVQEPAPKVAAALARVAQRYARTLEITVRDLQDALQSTFGPTNDEVPPVARGVPTLDTLA